MKTILITGANGYLASYIYLLNKDKFHWIRMTRKDADLSDPESVKNLLNPKILIFASIRQLMRQQLCVKKILNSPKRSMLNRQKRS